MQPPSRYSICLLGVCLLAPSLNSHLQAGDFEKIVLTERYYCDGISSGDLNRDGHTDVVAGPYWYEGPTLAQAHEFYPAQVFPTEPSPTDSMFSYVHDLNGDDWPDILVFGRVHLHQAFWYENPRGQKGSWPKHFVFHRIQGESPPFLDANGDGRPEIIAHWQNHWGLIRPNWTQPDQPWSFQNITAEGTWHHFYHGTGLGDINGDGLPDLLLNEGWYQQPAETNALWIRHEYAFGNKGGAQMFAYDVDGDGDNDVVSALDAHGWGLAWFENMNKDTGIAWQKHMIMGDRSEESTYGVAFSQPHALEIADMNGDGLTDIIVGKRRWAHGPNGDVEPNADPVIYWFELTRPRGQVQFVPHLIDAASGVGVQITVADVNADQRPDVLAASKLGAFVFLNQMPSRQK